ncbi:unnamed protein product, partial [Mycena citricolor]
SLTVMDSSPTLYSQRPEWDDVVPLEQFEKANPLAPILYSDEYKDATNYLRAVLQADERSERVMALTEHVIRLNPAHYSAWQYRYETFTALKLPIADEMTLMDELADKFLKTYQVWHHRRLLLQLPQGQIYIPAELTYIAQILRQDEKNYHTWAHRQWLLASRGDDALWAGELDFVDAMLNNDVRNNSAWHHRFFVVFQSGVREGDEDRERVLRRELIFVKQNISLAPNNASAWNYLRGVLEYTKRPLKSVATFVLPYSVPLSPDVKDLVDLENPPPGKDAQLPCVAAVEFLADVREEEGKIDEAIALWRSLADVHDPIRKKYWDYRIAIALTGAE